MQGCKHYHQCFACMLCLFWISVLYEESNNEKALESINAETYYYLVCSSSRRGEASEVTIVPLGGSHEKKG
jgi:hypothetical protein